MKSKTLRRVLTAFLTTSCLLNLNACAKKTEYVLLEPPSLLLNECPHPTAPPKLMSSKSIREYAFAVTELNTKYQTALDTCNADKLALQAWYKEMREAKQNE